MGTWCDGIPLLFVDQLDRVTFTVSGVGYFPLDLAPFETEWHFQNRRDPAPETIVLRLGNTAFANQQTARQNRHPERIFESRPSRNSDWMIAVELTDI